MIDPAAINETAIRALSRQGDIWRRLLAGGQRPDQLLDRKAYIGAAARLLAAARRIALYYLQKWSWPILLAAGIVGAAIWAALTYAPEGTSRITTVVISAAGFLGISWLSVRATLGSAPAASRERPVEGRGSRSNRRCRNDDTGKRKTPEGSACRY